jgi:hypothetical protein
MKFLSCFSKDGISSTPPGKASSGPVGAGEQDAFFRAVAPADVQLEEKPDAAVMQELRDIKRQLRELTALQQQTNTTTEQVLENSHNLGHTHPSCATGLASSPTRPKVLVLNTDHDYAQWLGSSDPFAVISADYASIGANLANRAASEAGSVAASDTGSADDDEAVEEVFSESPETIRAGLIKANSETSLLQATPSSSPSALPPRPNRRQSQHVVTMRLTENNAGEYKRNFGTR